MPLARTVLELAWAWFVVILKETSLPQPRTNFLMFLSPKLLKFLSLRWTLQVTRDPVFQNFILETDWLQIAQAWRENVKEPTTYFNGILADWKRLSWKIPHFDAQLSFYFPWQCVQKIHIHHTLSILPINLADVNNTSYVKLNLAL